MIHSALKNSLFWKFSMDKMMDIKAYNDKDIVEVKVYDQELIFFN